VATYCPECTEPTLTVQVVYQQLCRLGDTQGAGSHARLDAIILDLMANASKTELPFIIRMILSKGLGVGAGNALILHALSNMYDKEYDAVARKFAHVPDVDRLLAWLQADSSDIDPSHADSLVTIPVCPKAARPVSSLDDAVERMWSSSTALGWLAEHKYDGERLQIHIMADAPGNKVSVQLFSRNLRNVTHKYPDVQQVVASCFSCDLASAVLDAEVVPVADGIDQPFQTLMRRKRKDVTLDSIKIDVCIYLFDCLFFNGQSAMTKSLAARRKHLTECFPQPKSRRLEFAAGKDLDMQSTEHLKQSLLEVFTEASTSGSEGLILKS